LKEAFIKIYEKELEGKLYKDCLIEYVKTLIDFYEELYDESKKKFLMLLKKHSFEALLKAEDYYNPTVTLYHGAGEYKFYGTIDDGGAVFPSDEEIGVIVPVMLHQSSSCRFTESIIDEVRDWEVQIKTSVVYTWLSLMWQDLKGYQYGTKVATLENSVIRVFVFNDLSWEEHSAFNSDHQKTEFKNRYFKRDLLASEIYARVNLTRSGYSHKHYYRKFKSEGSSVEFFIGSDYVFKKKDASGLEETKFENIRELKRWLKIETDKLILSGFEEIVY